VRSRARRNRVSRAHRACGVFEKDPDVPPRRRARSRRPPPRPFARSR
jgi:hypothetical protein